MNPIIAVGRAVLSATGRDKLTILIYHRVRSEIDPLFPNDVDARRFDEQMSWVAGMLNVLPLEDAIGLLREGRLPPRVACLTFDDGYADNFDIALPILVRHRLPATIFVATGFLDGGRMWNDTIIEAIRRAPGSAIAVEALGFPPFPINSPQARRAAINHIIARLKYLPAAERVAQADSIAGAVGEPLPDDLMMTSEQVRAVHRAGISIGGHTVTHPILTQLDPATARGEIRAGRAALESIIAAPVRSFAYPNGKPGTDYDASHVAMVREAGFTAAVSTRWGVANATSDSFELPRFTPWGRTPLRFGVGLARNHLAQYER